MKPEPLKKKFHFGYEDFEESGDRYYSEEDIKSAVDWLLQELDLQRHTWSLNAHQIIKDKIKKAFEDVTK